MDSGHAYPSLSERMTNYWERAVRIATRFAIAFGLSTALAIGIGFAVTDNAFAQIAVTVLAAFGFWIPFAVLVSRLEQWRKIRGERKLAVSAPAPSLPDQAKDRDWQRLIALAPGQSERLVAIRRSLETSRLSLGRADLDPGAHDLCVLIDRRLPELIRHGLDDLAPDDTTRRRQLGELIDLIEQFARHCGRQRDGQAAASAYEAEVLRRRFEAHLADQRGVFDPR